METLLGQGLPEVEFLQQTIYCYDSTLRALCNNMDSENSDFNFSHFNQCL